MTVSSILGLKPVFFQVFSSLVHLPQFLTDWAHGIVTVGCFELFRNFNMIQVILAGFGCTILHLLTYLDPSADIPGVLVCVFSRSFYAGNQEKVPIRV